jgi:glycosyltransferase involved in cell wall biosynthesis
MRSTDVMTLQAEPDYAQARGSKRSARCLVIVPAYNEERSIRSVVERVRRQSPGFDVVVIDDGSTDCTAQIAEDVGARVLRHPFNLGIGGAVQSGYRYAFDEGYELAVQVDGDGQHDPAEIERLMSAMGAEEVDMVYGSRFLEDSGYRAPAGRRLGIRLFSLVLSKIVRQTVTDPTSGFRLCNRRAIELFARDYPHDYPEVEAILMVHAHQLRMREVAVRMQERQGGRSSITSIESAYYMIKVLLAIFVGLFRRRPVPERGGEAPVVAERNI